MSTIQVNGEHYPAVIVEKSSESLNGRVEAPLILSFPHSGEKYPDDFDTNPELSFNVLDFPNDKYVNELYQERNNLNLTSIHANFPRTYIDVNRHQHNIDVNMIKKGEDWYGRIHPTGAETGTTLFWSKTKEVFEIYSHKLSHDELKQRLAKCFVPYHQLMTYHIQKIHQDHGKAFVLDCHSMTQFDGKKRGRKERPQIDIGNRNGQSCSSEYSECVSDTFSSLGYDVKVNGRFLGGEIILRYGWPEINQHILQVEIRRDLYMDEDTRDRNERFTKMQKDCGAALKEIKNFVKQKTS
jgi:N-formylglutamate deformylase